MNPEPLIYRLLSGAASIVLCLSGTPSLSASEPLSESHGAEISTLEDYLSEALAANPQLKAFEQRYNVAMQRIPQASALPDPMIQITHFVESVQTRTGPQENVIMLSQRLPWFGKLGTREDAASAEAEALLFAFQNQQLMLARMVSLGFYEYGYTGKAIDLTRENLALLQDLEPIVEEKVRAGGDLNALLRLKVEIGKIRDKLETLTQKQKVQSARLSELLGSPEPTLLPLPEWGAPEIVNFDGASLAQSIETNNPELAMLERKIASAGARHELARLDGYPDLTLGLNYIQLGDPTVNPMTPDAGQDPWGVTLSINLPIWRGKYNAAISEALANTRAVESEYENRLNALRADLSASLATLDDANRRITLYGDELLQLAEQALKNSQASYQSGRTGILEVIDSERSLLDLQLLYWRAASDAWQQRIVIQTLVNQPILGTFPITQ